MNAVGISEGVPMWREKAEARKLCVHYIEDPKKRRRTHLLAVPTHKVYGCD